MASAVPAHRSPSGRTPSVERAHAGLWMALGWFLALLLLLAAFGAAPAAADITFDTSVYANNDNLVNTINKGYMLAMMLQTPPSTFAPNAFIANATALYASADAALVYESKLELVAWCGKLSPQLNDSVSCPAGASNNNDVNNNYVYLQLRIPTWAGSTVTSPELVDVSSLKVVDKMLVKSFAGTYDPDTNTSSTTTDYIQNISYNTAAVYAVFGVLLAVVVISLIVMCVCICKRDNAMANVNKSIVDKAIQKLASSGHRSRHSSGPTTFSEHYNMAGDAMDAASTGPMPSAAPPTSGENYSPREGTNGAMPSSAEKINADNDREMQEMKARLMRNADSATTVQRPTY